MSRLLPMALVLAAPALAHADDELHRLAISVGVGSERPPTAELAVRPGRNLEIALAGAMDESDAEPRIFGTRREKLGRSALTARAIGVFFHDATWQLAGHIGAGVGYDHVTVVEHHMDPGATTGFDTSMVDDRQTGAYVRGDAGVTAIVGPAEARASCGLDGSEMTPYVAVSIGLSFW